MHNASIPMDRARRAVRRPEGPWTPPRRTADGRPTRTTPPATPAISFGPRIYLVQTQPGFEFIAWSEIEARYAGAAISDQVAVPSQRGREEPHRTDRRRDEPRRNDNRRSGSRQGDLTRGGKPRARSPGGPCPIA